MNKELFRAAVNDIKLDEQFKRKLAEKMKETPKKSNKTYNFGLLAASAAVLIIMAVFIQNKIGFLPDKRIAVLRPGESIALSHSKGAIYINKAEGVRPSKIFIPEDAYSKDYKLEQLQQVFGRNPLPEMPKGFQTESNLTNITFDSSGKMLFMSTLLYSKEIGNREAPSISIKLNKEALPINDCIYASKPKESTISGTKVVIGAATIGDHYDNTGKPTVFYDSYSATFIYQGIGYNIVTERTDGQTMIDLLNSIIK